MSKKRLVWETIGMMAVGLFALLGWYFFLLILATL